MEFLNVLRKSPGFAESLSSLLQLGTTIPDMMGGSSMSAIRGAGDGEGYSLCLFRRGLVW